MIFGQGKNGWTESYYIEATDYDAAKARYADLASTRAKLLGKGSYIDGVRVSDEAILNDAFPIDVGSTTDTQVAVTDTPWNSIYVRAQAGALYRRQFHLRGVPDSWIVIDPTNGRPAIPATAREAFNAWAFSMTKRTPVCMLKVMTKTLDAVKVGGPPLIDTPYTKVNVGTVAGLDAVPYVLMRKWRGPDKKLLNRRWDVIAYTAPWLTISLPFAALSNAALDYGGFILRRVPGYSAMTDVYLTRYAAKKTGRAFFVSAGASHNKQAEENGLPMLGIMRVG